MDAGALRALHPELVDAVADPRPGRCQALETRLAGLRGREWCRLDEAARHRSLWQPTRQQVALARVPDWPARLVAAADSPSATTSLLTAVVAAMHWDGHLRQPAVKVLERLPGVIPAAVLALRAADWVPPVAAQAQAALRTRTDVPELAVAIAIVLEQAPRLRGGPVAEQFLSQVADGPAEVLRGLTTTGERGPRWWALRALDARGLLDLESLIRHLGHDPDPLIAAWCAERVLERAEAGTADPHDIAPRLLRARRAVVRALAVQRLPDEHLDREALRGFLFDRSASVRGMARIRWAARWGDCAAVYESALTSGDPSGALVVALRGLSEAGHADAVRLAVPFLAHPAAVVRHAAVGVVGRRGIPDVVMERLPGMLLDDSPKVAKAALRHLRLYARAVPPDVLAELDRRPEPHAAGIARSLRRRRGSWIRGHDAVPPS